MNFKEEMNQRVCYIEDVLKKFLLEQEGYQKTVIEAANYSLMAGGKRIRPMLMLETYRLFQGQSEEDIEPFMAAMEMIHTYSLVHDDLPAMDNDEYRRGRKTTHIVYGEAMGILAGDALLNYGFEVATRSFLKKENLEKAARAFSVLAKKPGIYGMIGGQAADVENCDRPMEQDKLDFIYKLKTGALIEGSMMIGAIMAGATDSQVEQMEEIAQKVGLAFQIQDDILDVIGDEVQIGKPVNSDEKNHKTTYVTLFGIEKAKEEVERLSKEALELLGSFPNQNLFLEELVQFLICREK